MISSRDAKRLLSGECLRKIYFEHEKTKTARVLVIYPSYCIARIENGECKYFKEFHKCLYPNVHPNMRMYNIVQGLMNHVRST